MADEVIVIDDSFEEEEALLAGSDDEFGGSLHGSVLDTTDDGVIQYEFVSDDDDGEYRFATAEDDGPYIVGGGGAAGSLEPEAPESPESVDEDEDERPTSPLNASQEEDPQAPEGPEAHVFEPVHREGMIARRWYRYDHTHHRVMDVDLAWDVWNATFVTGTRMSKDQTVTEGQRSRPKWMFPSLEPADMPAGDGVRIPRSRTVDHPPITLDDDATLSFSPMTSPHRERSATPTEPPHDPLGQPLRASTPTHRELTTRPPHGPASPTPSTRKRSAAPAVGPTPPNKRARYMLLPEGEWPEEVQAEVRNVRQARRSTKVRFARAIGGYLYRIQVWPHRSQVERKPVSP